MHCSARVLHIRHRALLGETERAFLLSIRLLGLPESVAHDANFLVARRKQVLILPLLGKNSVGLYFLIISRAFALTHMSILGYFLLLALLLLSKSLHHIRGLVRHLESLVLLDDCALPDLLESTVKSRLLHILVGMALGQAVGLPGHRSTLLFVGDARLLVRTSKRRVQFTRRVASVPLGWWN